jgi:hypothetical protein
MDPNKEARSRMFDILLRCDYLLCFGCYFPRQCSLNLLENLVSRIHLFLCLFFKYT